MALAELALTFVGAIPAPEPTKPVLDVKGDLTVKSRLVDDARNAIEEGVGRYRLNFLATIDDRWQIGGRQDSSIDHIRTGYGVLFARRMLGNGTALGVGELNDLQYDPQLGWDTDRSLGLHVFHRPTEEVMLVAHVPESLDDTQLVAQYARTFGESGPSIRVFAKDNIGVPRVQKLEFEVETPPRRGLSVAAQYNRVGTPTGYKESVEIGVKKRFGYEHRRK